MEERENGNSTKSKYFQVLDDTEILKAILNSRISDEIASLKQLSDVENTNYINSLMKTEGTL